MVEMMSENPRTAVLSPLPLDADLLETQPEIALPKVRPVGSRLKAPKREEAVQIACLVLAVKPRNELAQRVNLDGRPNRIGAFGASRNLDGKCHAAGRARGSRHALTLHDRVTCVTYWRGHPIGGQNCHGKNVTDSAAFPQVVTGVTVSAHLKIVTGDSFVYFGRIRAGVKRSDYANLRTRHGAIR